ncbi:MULTISPECIES: SDR family NAD(P)-dependent oxidoreductase [unclassified Streptomyces]|uniref:SDR family NAD(P)-dependent oxidoreductase n=1 Tax=unclassified Streptomyces TaxID=2593676 RepID=UPI0035DA0051
MPRYHLAGRTLLITGSTGGLGTALARALRDRGAHLALLDLDGDLAQRRAADLGPETVARGWAADVRDLDCLRVAADAAADHFGRLDVVVANAGVRALCDATRLEPRHEGVGVGSAHPTFFRTPMMDDVHADAAGTTLWGGNRAGLWKMIPLEQVVEAVVTGIERRSPMIVAPRRNALPARIPGLVRPLVDRIGFRGTTVPDAIARVTGTGWITRR